MIRKHRNIIIASTLILGLSGSFALGSRYAQNRIHTRILVSDSTDNSAENGSGNDKILQGELSKTSPNTITVKGLSETSQGDSSVEVSLESEDQEAISLEYAKSLLSEMPDAPLLQKNAAENYGDSSLQNAIEDVNATSKDSTEIIREVCEEAGIDPDKAVVKDLTAEQIARIDQAVFEASDHPKD